ncbi:hypothetical protein [Adlercreutzia shanghongiae]|uniref:Uncharacterized protein n=1 Tax=Adlercreutzia shanghongiae TaxID=3111773 RepID=A0ABU6J0V8_9ACTN|nr:hypothetical protein [Adlercreutzia sp. R22]MEC4295660.1 hypothetical protein [Adlercreutzia sp. R22]
MLRSKGAASIGDDLSGAMLRLLAWLFDPEKAAMIMIGSAEMCVLLVAGFRESSVNRERWVFFKVALPADCSVACLTL